jgi:phosphoesterase RecJ-like protein
VYGALRDALAGRSSILLTGPMGPDGDSIGAALALQRLLRRHKANVDVGCTVPVRYAFLPGAREMVPDASLRPTYDAVVVLDGDRHRLTEPADAAFRAARFTALVDHHASSTSDGYDFAWIEVGAPSTTEMLYRGALAAGEAVDRPLATLLYTGAIFDTGGFRYSNATPATLRMAADLMERGFDHADICLRVLMERRPSGLRLAGLVYSRAALLLGGSLAVARVADEDRKVTGMGDADVEGVVDGLVHTRGVEVAALLVQRGPTEVKVSLRSRGRIDLVPLARALSPTGGGHPKAAGAMMAMSLADAELRVVEVATAALAATH